jgi:hypothetical protein
MSCISGASRGLLSADDPIEAEGHTMGRTMPEIQHPRSLRDELALAQAVDEAVARVAPVTLPDSSDGEADVLVDHVVAELDGATAATGSAVAGPSDAGILSRLPIVFLDDVEVTQEVQDLGHSVPLVARKPTIVRVYLRYGQSPVSVRGELKVSRRPSGPWHTVSSLGPAHLHPSRSGRSLADLRSRRADLGFSLNFRIPAAFTREGPLWLRMGRIRRATTGTPVPSLAHLPLNTVRFRARVSLRVRLVRLRYTMGSPPVVHEPSATDVDLITSWLRRAYPISSLELSTTTVNAAPAPPFGAAQINAQLIALRAVDVSTGTDARTHYYGMVSDGGFFMRGLASGIPQTPQPGTVASGPTGPSGYAWDADGSYGDWYGGHELGHTVGRFHAEFCGAIGGAPYPFTGGQLSEADEAFVGLDVGDPDLGLPMRIMGGVDSHDVMTYCDDQWLSSFTYGGIYDRLIAEEALPAGASGGSAPAGALEGAGGGEPPEMRLIAALNLTTTEGSITSVLPSSGAEGGPAGEGEPDHDITVRLRDAGGAILDDRPAAFMRSTCEHPDDDVTGIVDAVLPTVVGAASVELLVDGQVVDSQPIGGEAAPVGELVQADRTAAGLGDEPGGSLDLRWEAPDAPPGQRYIVQLSDDAGATWRTVAVGLPEPALTVPPDELTGDEITVRVLATTGSGTTVVRTDTVPVR